jgi:hypothetical protein
VATAPKTPRTWPFPRKFALYLTDQRVSLNAWAKRHGIPQRTLHGWVHDGVAIPAVGIVRIARATRLSAEYWMNEDIQYPPPVEYENLGVELEKALSTVPTGELREILALLRDPDDRRKTLALRRAARSA